MKIYPKSLFPNKFKTQYKSYLKWRKIVYWLIFSLNTLFLFLQFKIKMFVFQPLLFFLRDIFVLWCYSHQFLWCSQSEVPRRVNICSSHYPWQMCRNNNFTLHQCVYSSFCSRSLCLGFVKRQTVGNEGKSIKMKLFNTNLAPYPDKVPVQAQPPKKDSKSRKISTGAGLSI